MKTFSQTIIEKQNDIELQNLLKLTEGFVIGLNSRIEELKKQNKDITQEIKEKNCVLENIDYAMTIIDKKLQKEYIEKTINEYSNPKKKSN